MRRTRRQIETAVERLELAAEPENQPAAIVVPDVVPPTLWQIAVLIEQAEVSSTHAELSQCQRCGYPSIPHSECVSCSVQRSQDYPRSMEWPTNGGVIKIPFRYVERQFLVRCQQSWCAVRGVAADCAKCNAPMASGQSYCLLCLDRALYPADQGLIDAPQSNASS